MTHYHFIVGDGRGKVYYYLPHDHIRSLEIAERIALILLESDDANDVSVLDHTGTTIQTVYKEQLR